jgi:hypothetical protein
MHVAAAVDIKESTLLFADVQQCQDTLFWQR